MKTSKLKKLAKKHGLNYIETTTAFNGYPENIRGALTGFKNFEQAEHLASKHGLNIESFNKREGQELWTRNNNNMYSPYELSCEDYGDDYSQLDKIPIDEYIEQLQDSYCDEDYLPICKKTIKALENMTDNQLIITYEGEYYDTIERHQMSFNVDSKYYTIGLI